MRLLSFLFLVLLAAPAARATVPASALPARPVPFAFVTDQAGVLSAADARNLDGGLHQFADKNGPQVVVVLVKTLGGYDVADYARSLGNAWGVGQRATDNGVIILVAPAEHKVSIEPGTGLKDQLPRSLTDRIISQHFGPAFKQGRYYDGLHAGLNVLLKALDTGAGAAAASPAAGEVAANYPNAPAADAPAPANAAVPQEPAPSSGIGLGTILLLVLGAGVVWFLLRRRSAAASAPANAPDFLGQGRSGNSNAGPGSYGPNPGYGPAQSSSGMGGLLGTAAAAAAGAAVGGYFSNRGHDNDGQASSFGGQSAGTGYRPGDNDAPAAPSAAHDYFADRDGSNDTDYFANTADDSSSGSSSYDDSSSGDSGGSFDSGSSDDSGSSGSW